MPSCSNDSSSSANAQNRKIHASNPDIENSSNSRRIMNPTPAALPNSSVSAAIFHAIEIP